MNEGHFRMKRFAFIWPVVLLTILSGCVSPGIRHFNPIFFPDLNLTQKESRRPFLGIHMENVPEQYLSETLRKENAVYVSQVLAETSAEEAGIIAGDIIMAADGEPFINEGIEPLSQLKKTIIGKNTGDNIEISIIREGKPLNIVAKLGEEKKVPPKVS